MKKHIAVISALIGLAALADGLLVSSSSDTVTKTVTDEWRNASFNANPNTGDITVMLTYERVVRAITSDSTNVISLTELKTAAVPWATATNIAPALAMVRAQLQAALPTLLANP